jgi:hypothetical protein
MSKSATADFDWRLGIRRRLLMWHQYKRARTRFQKLNQRGVVLGLAACTCPGNVLLCHAIERRGRPKKGKSGSILQIPVKFSGNCGATLIKSNEIKGF